MNPKVLKLELNPKILRLKLIEETRKFFWNEGFLETDTPALVLSPGMEPHIHPIEVMGKNGKRASFLHTSPEFAMKKILAEGQDKIFQISKCYRLEPKSTTHMPEFTMIEWYRSHSNYEAIMDDVENLFRHLAERLWHGTRKSLKNYGEQNLKSPWPRFTIEECFQKFCSLQLKELQTKDLMFAACKNLGLTSNEKLEWDDYFFLIMMNKIEPALQSLKSPAIIYKYPPSQAALSNLVKDPDGTMWAKRFEVYAGGLELGNAFDELTDGKIQRARFEKDMKLRKELYKDQIPLSPIDESFIESLEKLPPSGGIAMGLDRVAMFFSDSKDIRETLYNEPYYLD